MDQMSKWLGEGAQIVAVVKMDGYGHGAPQIAKMLEDRSYVWGYATASMEEALLLRKAGITKPILVLGCVFPDQYEEMLRHEIRATIYMEEMANEISKVAVQLGKQAYVHIKIDTGMGRLGFYPEDASVDCIERMSRLEHLQIEGVYTHLAKADEADKSYTHVQQERFAWMKNSLESKGVHVTYYHCNNSAGIIDFPDMKHDLVRAGIAIYGMYPSLDVCHDAIKLQPALELISHVTFIKEVAKGTPISYGGTYVADRTMKVATIPVGYGDGYARGLSNQAEVLIHGKRARILGRVCMDQFMVDVTEIPDVAFLDKVVLIGTDGEETITVEELSQICGRFNYEFVCCLGRRVPRVYIKDGKVVEQVEYLT
jgi:alanine racemase